MHAFFPPDLLQPCVLALARVKKRACLDLIHWLLYGGIAEGPAQDSLDDRCITCRHQRRKVQYPERTQHGGPLMQMDVDNVAPLRMKNILLVLIRTAYCISLISNLNRWSGELFLSCDGPYFSRHHTQFCVVPKFPSLIQYIPLLESRLICH